MILTRDTLWYHLVRFFVHASHKWSDRMIELGVLASLHDALSRPQQKRSVMGDILPAIANSIANAIPYLQIVIELGTLERVIELHDSWALSGYVSEEVWLWSCVLSAADPRTQVSYLVQIGVAAVLCDLIRQGSSSTMDDAMQQLSLFLSNCKYAGHSVWQSAVTEMEECGGMLTLQSIAENEDDSRSSCIAEDVLSSCVWEA